ncbi:hypothetical protein ANANG_G00164800 [Anguilla anguilla]|uniref:Spartin n=1 Tax=Anguilla anguilla TaxID=7936 RepID=A0A9D3MAL9_ANGAN|nr:hypothetical protein ANANG_G00164800 [Anguilla anguilla]
MEESNVEAFDPLGLWIIRDDYEKALECLDRALTADEVGSGAEALELYRRGRYHLHRGMGVDSARPECVGSAWDAARQMQRKMSHTLGNIATRLAALETTATPAPTRPAPKPPLALDQQGASAPSRTPLPGFAPVSVSPTMHRGVPGDLPPAYSPQAADGHLTLSYGTEAGELSLVRETPPSAQPLPQPPKSQFGPGGRGRAGPLLPPARGADLLRGPRGARQRPVLPGVPTHRPAQQPTAHRGGVRTRSCGTAGV